MAAYSDSTLTNSHGASSPSLTIAVSASTMCVWGEIGQAGITSGRHSATVRATAREPSSCSSMEQALALPDHECGARARGRRVAVGQAPAEAIADRRDDGVDADRPRELREDAEQGRIRPRLADVLARDARGGHGEQ